MYTQEHLVTFLKQHNACFSFSWHSVAHVNGQFVAGPKGSIGPGGAGLTGNPYCIGTTESDAWIEMENKRLAYEAMSKDKKIDFCINKANAICVAVTLDLDSEIVFNDFHKVVANLKSDVDFQIRDLRLKPIQVKVPLPSFKKRKEKMDEANQKIHQLTMEIKNRLTLIRCEYDKFFISMSEEDKNDKVLKLRDGYAEDLGIYGNDIDGNEMDIIGKYNIREGLFLHEIVKKDNGRICTLYVTKSGPVFAYLKEAGILKETIQATEI